MHYLFELKETLQTTLTQIKIKKEISEIKIEFPSNPEHGDIATPIALHLAKELKMPPMTIAEKIQAALPQLDFIEKSAIVKPGYLNFFLAKEIFAQRILEKVLSNQPEETNKDNRKTKIIIEHTSVNPNKAMHVGHLRNAIIGDCLARLYKKAGYTVEIYNYINDTGVQVADTTTAILNLQRPQPKDQDFDLYCWDLYTEINQQYEINSQLLEKRKTIIQEIEKGENNIARQAKEIADKIVQCHLESLAQFAIFYDLLIYESDIIKFGFWETAFDQLKQSPHFVYKKAGKQKGCWVLRYESCKFDDKIFVRSDGTKVYTAKDTAYHMWKFGLLDKDFLYSEWKFGRPEIAVWRTDPHGQKQTGFGRGNLIINIIDERQTYPQEMVKHALKTLGHEKEFSRYEHVAYGVVTLSGATAKELGIDTVEKKTGYAMSGRKGIGVKVKDLVKLLYEKIKSEMNKNNLPDDDLRQIAVGAIKHYLLKSHPSSAIIFDSKQALQLTGNTGPYLQYSFTRVSSLLRKAGEFSPTTKEEAINDEEFQLIKQISLWPEVQKQTLATKNLVLLAEYAYNLSALFHRFYETNDILHSPPGVKNFRLTIVIAYQRTIQDVLSIMGIQPLKRM